MLAGLSWLQVAAFALAAFAVDQLLGEPRRFHPLVGFGALAARLEASINRHPGGSRARTAGIAGVALLVVPCVMLCAFPPREAIGEAVLSVGVLYLALGARSLRMHIEPIGQALIGGEIERARTLAARVVSRDLSSANEEAIARAAVESALENGNDAVFGALFWFGLAGAPGALAYRLVNTLDAMWGYRNARFQAFGWCAARADDAMNFIPARLTAATYALLGNVREAIRCWRTQARAWESPNAGPVMAAGAGALGLRLGGAAVYDGARHERPALGTGRSPGAADIQAALRLVASGCVLWLGTLVALAALERVLHA